MQKFNMKNITLGLLLIFPLFSHAQNDKPNRESFVLNLAVDSVQYYEQQIESSPYFIEEGILQIYPTEELFVEAEMKNDSIISMKTVKEIEFPEKTITIKFNQQIKGQKTEMMLLSVTNPFDKQLIYDAHMFIIGNDRWLETSIIPILPKLVGYEMWNDIIVSLVLDNWRIIPK
jgi:hypothetical protein